MLGRISLLWFTAFTWLAFGCKSYEDSFNRNKNSNGLYITNSGSNTVSQFAVDPLTSKLTDLGTVSAGTNPVFVTVNSAGTFAYVVNSASNDIYVYSISKATRKLTKTSSIAAGTTPRMIVFHRGGNYAYVLNQGSADISKFIVSSTTGELTSLGATTAAAGTPVAIALYTDYAVVARSDTNQLMLFDINTSTGAITADATPTATTTGNPLGVTISDSGTGHIYAPAANGTIERVPVAAWPTPAAAVAAGTTPAYIALNGTASRAFVSNYGAGTISQYTVASGVLTNVGTVTACTNPAQIRVDSADYVYLVCGGENKVQLYSTTSTTMSLVESYPVGTTPTSIGGY